MEDDMYKEALIAFNKGDYEEVIKLYLDWEICLSEKEKVLLRESRKQVTEQYLFLIKEHIHQKEYDKARKLQKEYISKYNFDNRVADIEIVDTTNILEDPDKLSYKDTLNNKENNQSIIPETNQSKLNEINQPVSKHKKKLIYIGIIFLPVICFIFYLIFDRKDTFYQDDVEIVPETKSNQFEYRKDVKGNYEDDVKIVQKAKSNQFEYIKDVRGNYEVDIQWPLSLTGISDIHGIQQAIIKRTFGKESNNIHDCVEAYFKKYQKNEEPNEYYEAEGQVKVSFQQKFNDLHVFKIYFYISTGGGAAFSIRRITRYIYYDNSIGRALDINDLFNDYSRTLKLVNKHISLDEYAQKAEELPNNFSLSSSGITFIFPKYSIGYGYQDNVGITLGYDELNDVLSETFKKAIGR